MQHFRFVLFTVEKATMETDQQTINREPNATSFLRVQVCRHGSKPLSSKAFFSYSTRKASSKKITLPSPPDHNIPESRDRIGKSNATRLEEKQTWGEHVCVAGSLSHSPVTNGCHSHCKPNRPTASERTGVAERVSSKPLRKMPYPQGIPFTQPVPRNPT